MIFAGNIRPYFSPKPVISCSSFQYIENVMKASDTFLPASFRRPLQILTPFYIAFIIWASLQSSTSDLEIPYFDKILHAGVYGILFMIITLAWPKISNIRIWVACFIFGGLMEVAQGTLTSVRTPSFLDLMANGFGAFVALIVIFILNQKFAR